MTGELSSRERVVPKEEALQDVNFRTLVECCALCNTANIVEASEGKVWGDPTEIALQVFAYKMQMGKPMLRKIKEPVEEFPFSSDAKRMSMVCQGQNKAALDVYTKGSEIVLTICDNTMDATGDLREINEGYKELVARQQEEMAKEGLRVLTMAYRQVSEADIGKPVAKWDRAEAEQRLTFLGLVGIRDTPRVESEISVRQCHRAGITVHMLTGDHKATALSIAKEVGILEPVDGSKRAMDASAIVPIGHSVMTATEFDALSDEQVPISVLFQSLERFNSVCIGAYMLGSCTNKSTGNAL